MRRASQGVLERSLIVASVSFALLLSAVTARAGTVVVSPPNMDGWTFDTTNSSGTPPNSCAGGCVATMVFGPATPPIGAGSAHLATGTDGSESAQIRNQDYQGVKLRDITKLTYCTYMKTNNGQQFPYLTLFIDNDNDGTFDNFAPCDTASGCIDDEIFFEPPYQQHSTGNSSLPDQGPTQLNTWQCWDALEGGWWSDIGAANANPGTDVKSLSDYETVEPNATIVNPSTGPGGVRLTVGFASPGDHFDGNVDKVIIGVNGVDTVYDFEPVSPPPTSADQCKKGGWQNFNNPSFKNQGQCVSFVQHEKHP